MVAPALTSWTRLAKLALGERLPDDSWHPADKPYPSLFGLEAYTRLLAGRSGIFAIWHLGVRPQWLKVGAGADLRQNLDAAAGLAAFAAFRANGGVFAAWAHPAPERFPGVVLALSARLQPRLQSVVLPGEVGAAENTAPLAFPLPPGATAPMSAS